MHYGHLETLLGLRRGFADCTDSAKANLRVLERHGLVKADPRRTRPHIKEWENPLSMHHWKLRTWYEKRPEDYRLTAQGRRTLKGMLDTAKRFGDPLVLERVIYIDPRRKP